MANSLHTIFDNVRAAIGTGWPECKPNGIYTALEVVTVSMNKKAESSQLPFAAFDYEPGEGTEWGIDNEVDDGELTVYYVTSDGTTIPALLQKLESLRDTLYDTGITNAQVIGFPSVSISFQLPLNQYFASTQRPFRCGAVRCRLITGTTA